ncbi:MAG TPA: hypothetical protein PKJ84_08535 [Anaerolineales bacterium]|nr:hypothetical protein [Anaerolineales bacterium]
MYDNNALINGKFLHNLNGWTPSAGVTYSAGDGDDNYGVAVLPVGGSIWQEFSVDEEALQSLHISVKAVGASLSGSQATLVIKDNYDNTVITQNLSGTADTWTENLYSVGISEGTTYRITITNNSAAGDIKIDDVWIWFIPITRAQIATAVHAKLGRLATERSLSTTPSGTLTEGSYTYAIDAGLRTIGAIDEEVGLPSVRFVESEQVQMLIGEVRREMLEFLQTEYAVEVDTSTGPYSQQLSQKASLIGDIIGSGKGGGGTSGGAIIQKRISHD